jgi:hypothetical protein
MHLFQVVFGHHQQKKIFHYIYFVERVEKYKKKFTSEKKGEQEKIKLILCYSHFCH